MSYADTQCAAPLCSVEFTQWPLQCNGSTPACKPEVSGFESQWEQKSYTLSTYNAMKCLKR